MLDYIDYVRNSACHDLYLLDFKEAIATAPDNTLTQPQIDCLAPRWLDVSLDSMSLGNDGEILTNVDMMGMMEMMELASDCGVSVDELPTLN